MLRIFNQRQRNFQFSIFNFQLRRGYIFLLTVLFVGIIAFSVVGSYLLFSTVALQSGYSVEQSTQALELARTCADRGLLSLQNSLSYVGSETVALTEGECKIYTVGGSGNKDRILCTEGTVGSTTRRFEIFIDTVLTSIKISSWRDVSSITACSS